MQIINLDKFDQYPWIKEILGTSEHLYIWCKNEMICILYNDKVDFRSSISKLDLDNYFVEFVYRHPTWYSMVHCKEEKHKELFDKLTPFLFSLKL